MDIRAVNFVATVIGWAVLVIGTVALLIWGIEATKPLLSDAAKFFVTVGVFAVGGLVMLYVTAADWFRDRDKSDELDQARRRKMEDELTRLRAERKEPRNEW